VTLAAWLIMIGSVFVVLTVFERMAGLNDLETREAVEEFLSRPPGNGMGLDVSGVLELMRIAAMVAGGCAAASAILGFHVLKRSHGARIGLSVLAVPLLVSGLVTGGFMSSLVAASAVMLWLQPARDWFDGKPARPEPTRGEREAARSGPGPDRSPWSSAPHAPPPDAPPPGPRPYPGFGAVPPASHTSTQVAPRPVEAPPSAPSGPFLPPVRPRRPDAVVWACVLTWVFSGLAAFVMGISALVMATSPDLVFDELYRQNPDLAEQGVSERTIQVATYVTASVTVLWSVAASVIAVLVLRRVRWARVALLVSASAAGALCLLAAALGSLLLVVPLTACAATITMLLRADVRGWAAAP
jgi:hypothetical protein